MAFIRKDNDLSSLNYDAEPWSTIDGHKFCNEVDLDNLKSEYDIDNIAERNSIMEFINTFKLVKVKILLDEEESDKEEDEFDIQIRLLDQDMEKH